MIHFLQTHSDRLKPERFFFWCALVYGLIFLVITPPFQTPDELSHFYRAYQVSEGDFIGISKDQRVGGDLPKSLADSYEPFRDLRRHENIGTSWKVIGEQFNKRLNEQDRKFVDFPNTGMYSFVSYIPQAIGILIVRSFDWPPVAILYGGRFAALLFWLFSTYFVIRLFPFYKWLFTLLALLPMAVATHVSLSADTVTDVTAFYVMAYSFHLAYTQPRIGFKDLLLFILFGLILALAKVVYLPLLLLFFFIPYEKFDNKRSYYAQMLLLFGISGAAALCWSAVMKGLYIPYNLYNPVASEDPMFWSSMVSCANMPDQLHYILSQSWWYVPHVMIKSMLVAFPMYCQSYIGTFGWLDTYLPVWIVAMSYAVIMLVARGDSQPQVVIKLPYKFLFLLCFITTMSLILVSQLLTWVCVGEDCVDIIQGRYLIPILPLLFMLLYANKGNRSRYVVPMVCVFSIVLLSYSSYVIYERYFVTEEVERVNSFSCHAEGITNGSFITDSSTILLDNANTRSHEKSRSGKYSAKVSRENPYTFTYHLYDCKFGDSLIIDAYRLGENGGIMISGDVNEFSHFTREPIEKDSLGWEHLQSRFAVPSSMKGKEVKVFIYYNEGNDSSYFDDITVTHRQLK